MYGLSSNFDISPQNPLQGNFADYSINGGFYNGCAPIDAGLNAPAKHTFLSQPQKDSFVYCGKKEDHKNINWMHIGLGLLAITTGFLGLKYATTKTVSGIKNAAIKLWNGITGIFKKKPKPTTP